MRVFMAVLCWTFLVPLFVCAAPIPNEPVDIGFEPQFFLDDYLVDNRWGTNFRAELTARVFHPPKKDERNPLLPVRGGYPVVLKNGDTFQMWYQVHQTLEGERNKNAYAIAYAESKDGIVWHLPKLGLYEWKGTKENNIVLRGLGGSTAHSPYLMDLPPEQRRGYRYVMLYVMNTPEPETAGLHLIGSQNGIDWDPDSDRLIIRIYPDAHCSISWDPRSKEYVCFTRATNQYRDNTVRRRIFRLAHENLWEEWPVKPESPLIPDQGEKWPIAMQNVLIPDEEDARRGRNDFYGMPTRYYAGVYWGFLQSYRFDHEVVSELAFSRDGKQFERFRDRVPLIDLGPSGAWDAGMVFSAPGWVEVGDEWWFYYAASAGPHSDSKASRGLGLARLRKEGFVSLTSPAGGGGVVTRTLRWPGGDLIVNADARAGELRVRVTDEKRKEIPGFGKEESVPFVGDSVAHTVAWKTSQMDQLKGRDIRLEFLMERKVDLYTFRADGARPRESDK